MVKLTGEYFEVPTKPGDRWDLLAFDYLGDASLQGLVLRANFEPYIDNLDMPPLVLEAGITVRIPVIIDDEVSEQDLPPWKRANPNYENGL